ncbi:MAG: hypothetical protein IPN69_15010 [Acidobacteria bacterium]|nr:hypothetical protein [Acidobacteriota bacterium]MBK8147733.1 hypothetical protein [Acidobacteriota bacterium]MBK8812021.1 hypothetical protein [Acidobacteriota bacterium]
MKAKIVSFWSERQGHILQIVLAAIFILFIAIMIGVYVIAKRANPILLDEKGQPKYTQSGS